MMAIDFGIATTNFRKYVSYIESKIVYGSLSSIAAEFLFLGRLLKSKKYHFHIETSYSAGMGHNKLLTDHIYLTFCERYKGLVDRPRSHRYYGKVINVLKKSKETDKADTVGEGLNDEFFTELLELSDEYKRTKNIGPILDFMATPFIAHRYDSYGFGNFMLEYLTEYLYHHDRIFSINKVEAVFLQVVCNDLIQPNVRKRLTITQAHD